MLKAAKKKKKQKTDTVSTKNKYKNNTMLKKDNSVSVSVFIACQNAAWPRICVIAPINNALIIV